MILWGLHLGGKIAWHGKNIHSATGLGVPRWREGPGAG
jgi:hypothetical protein